MAVEAQSLWEEEQQPYVRPSMADVRAIPWNGLTAASSFSGCGGSSLGLRMAGFRVPYAVEFVPAAADTYEANSDAYVDRRDIREIDGADVLSRLDLYRGQLDLFESSPPCSGFSMAGIRERGWNKTKSYSDTKQERVEGLFEEFVRVLADLRPRALLAENVPGMIQGATVESYAHLVVGQLTALGYRVQAKVLNAANYGTPQERRRLIFVGLRSDVAGTWEWPPVEPHAFSLRDALGSVDPEDPDHAPFLVESSMERFAVGRAWNALRLGEPPACRYCGKLQKEHRPPRAAGALAAVIDPGDTLSMGYDVEIEAIKPPRWPCGDGREYDADEKEYFMLTVPKLDRPSPTLTATAAQVGAASIAHPTECRKFTPAECKAICGFPADFVLTGTREQRVERMGRAVPPPMYRAIGLRLAEVLSGGEDLGGDASP